MKNTQKQTIFLGVIYASDHPSQEYQLYVQVYECEVVGMFVYPDLRLLFVPKTQNCLECAAEIREMLHIDVRVIDVEDIWSLGVTLAGEHLSALPEYTERRPKGWR